VFFIGMTDQCRDLFHLELAPMLAAVKVPVQCVNAPPYGPFAPVTNIAGNRKYNPQFDALIIDNAGHFPMLDQPEGLNVKLQTIIKAIIRSNESTGIRPN
jgi:pimeloyl-ACP methyl ester carboxylesterase